ncbi:MAG: methyltransferase domain-containing protein [Candidatus Bathyarchaeia archaeon]
MKLNVGCGRQKFSGFINLDVARSVQPDIVADACHLPFKHGVFTKVVSRRCIQHVNDTLAISEIYRVLVDRGKLVLIVASVIGWIYYKLRLSSSYGNYSIFHLYTKRRLLRLLRAFNNISIYKVRGRLFSFDYLVLAEKERN